MPLVLITREKKRKRGKRRRKTREKKLEKNFLLVEEAGWLPFLPPHLCTKVAAPSNWPFPLPSTHDQFHQNDYYSHYHQLTRAKEISLPPVRPSFCFLSTDVYHRISHSPGTVLPHSASVKHLSFSDVREKEKKFLFQVKNLFCYIIWTSQVILAFQMPVLSEWFNYEQF